MKMPPFIYAQMRDDIAAIAKARGVNIATADGGSTGLKTMWDLLTVVSRDRAFADTHPNYQAKIWVRILPNDGREYCFYYAGGCDDSHVSTALRRIKAELITAQKGGTP